MGPGGGEGELATRRPNEHHTCLHTPVSSPQRHHHPGPPMPMYSMHMASIQQARYTSGTPTWVQDSPTPPLPHTQAPTPTMSPPHCSPHTLTRPRTAVMPACAIHMASIIQARCTSGTPAWVQDSRSPGTSPPLPHTPPPHIPHMCAPLCQTHSVPTTLDRPCPCTPCT
jgi:hypothetical protein